MLLIDWSLVDWSGVSSMIGWPVGVFVSRDFGRWCSFDCLVADVVGWWSPVVIVVGSNGRCVAPSDWSVVSMVDWSLMSLIDWSACR